MRPPCREVVNPIPKMLRKDRKRVSYSDMAQSLTVWPVSPRRRGGHSLPRRRARPRSASARSRCSRCCSKQAGAPVSKDALVEAGWAGLADCGQQSDGPDRGPAAGLRRSWQAAPKLDRNAAAARLSLCRTGGSPVARDPDQFGGAATRRGTDTAGEAVGRGAAVLEPERRSGAGLLRRRDGRRHHHRPGTHQLAVRHRAKFDLHLQGPRRGREAGRPRAWRALCARRQRAEGRQQRARDRPDDRRIDRRARMGRALSTAAPTISSRFRTRSRCRRSARLHRACGAPKSNG